MLVIRRHAGESILIGDDIELEVIECGHNRVKLGIRAPRHVSVTRSEMKVTREQNLAAARSMSGGTIPFVPFLMTARQEAIPNQASKVQVEQPSGLQGQ
jgi:carbon storage regulator